MSVDSGAGPLPWAPNFKLLQSQVSFGAGNTAPKLVDANPFRVAIAFTAINVGGVCWVNPGSVASAGFQFPLSANNEKEFFFSQWGGLVQGSWFGFVAAPGGTIQILEVLWVETQKG